MPRCLPTFRFFYRRRGLKRGCLGFRSDAAIEAFFKKAATDWHNNMELLDSFRLLVLRGLKKEAVFVTDSVSGADFEPFCDFNRQR